MERPTRIPVPSQPTSPRHAMALSPARSVSPADRQLLYSPKHPDSSPKPGKNLAPKVNLGGIAAHGSQKSPSNSPVHIKSTVGSVQGTLQTNLNTAEPSFFTTNKTATTITSVAEANSVAFVSPLHQVYHVVDSSSLPDTFLAPPNRDYQHSSNPLRTVLTSSEQDSASSHTLSGKTFPLESVPSFVSLDASGSGFSLYSLPVPLGDKSNLEDEIVTADLTDGGNRNLLLRKMTKSSFSMPDLPSLSSQLQHTNQEKEALLSDLKAANSEISFLKSKCTVLEERDVKIQDTMNGLERTIQQLQQSMSSLKLKHTEELTELRQRMRKELETERERLLNQIRQQTKLKEEVSAKVYSLEEQVKKESAAEGALKERLAKLGNHHEMEALKVELNALRDLQLEIEQSHDLLVQTTDDQEKTIRSLRVERDSLQDELTRIIDENIEGSLLRTRLEATEARVTELEQERVAAVVAVEEKMISEAIRAKIEHSEQLSRLQQELEVYKPHLIPLREQDSGGDPKYSTGHGSWNAYKKNSKTQTEEMQLALESMEREGYGPSQVTAEDAIKYLWCKNKHSEKQKANLQQSLVQVIGKEKYNLLERQSSIATKQFEESEQRRLEMEKRLEEVHQEMAETEKVAQSSLEVIKKKLNELLLEREADGIKQKSLQQKEVVVSKENQVLKSKLNELKVAVARKTARMAELEADTSKQDSSSYQACLAAEKHQNITLKAKVESLASQLATRQKELARIQGTAASSPPDSKTMQEVTTLRAKIGELQGEFKLQKQQLNHITAQRGSLLERVDAHSLQVATLESQLSKEKTNSDMMQSKLDQVSDELHSKNQELEQTSARKQELQLEVASLRKDLQAAHENFCTLEVELVALQSEYNRCCEELSSSKVTSAELEHQFLSVSADATQCEQTMDSLEASLRAKESKLENTQTSLENEKCANKELRISVDRLSCNLDRTSKKLECLSSENSALKKDLASRKQDIQHLQQEAHSMRLELKESQAKTSTLQNETSRLQQELKFQAKDLTKSKDTVSNLRQKLTDTNRELNSLKHESEQLSTQLSSSEAENVRLLKTKESLQSDIQELKSRLSAQSNNLSERSHLLSKKEEEARVVAQERVALTAEISGLKREVQLLTSGRSSAEKGLSLKGSELEAEKKRLTECQRLLDEKIYELKKTELKVESLQCSLECESEKYSTLQLELSATKVELQDTREVYAKQSAEVRQMEEDHRTEIELLKESIQQVEDQLSQYRTKCSGLEGQLSTLGLEVEKLTAQAEEDKQELQSQLSTLTSELALSEQSKLSLVSEVAQQSQQMQTTKSNLNEQIKNNQSQVEKVLADLSIAQTQIKHLTKDLEEYQQQLKEERSKRVQLEDELDDQVSIKSTLTTQLREAELQFETERGRTKNLTADFMKSELKAQELSKELHETQEQLNIAEESVEETRTAFTETLNSVKASHKQERFSLQLESEQLSKDLSSTKESLTATKHQLLTCEEELSATNDKLTQMEQKCNQLEAFLTSESRDNRLLESDLTELQSTHAEVRMQVADLSEKLLVQTTIAEQLKVELQSSRKEYESLQEQTQLQRETAAASLNRIQKHNQDKCAELHITIREQADKLEEAHTSARALQRDLVTLKAENAQLESSLLDEKRESSQLSAKLNSEITALKLSEQKVEQLERISQVEQENKAKVEAHLEEEIAQRRKVEYNMETQQQELKSNAHELAKVQSMLLTETSKNEKINGDLVVAKAEVSSLHQRLKKISNTAHEFRVNSEQELQVLRQKYVTDKKLLKEKVKQLQKNLQVLSGQHECRGEEVSRLQASNQSLMKDQKELAKQLSDKKYQLQAKEEDCRVLQTKVTSLETQIKQMDHEMSLLGEAQVQYEQYKKRLEQQSRDEAQRVLSEVTDHMEQQHTAHKYLESLRSENERIVLKEKEREISQLKTELAHKKHEGKQDKMRMQHLEVEARHLKAQRKDHERSRRRLEARLEQVNDTLSRTLPVSQFSDSYRSTGPMHSSTPMFKFKRSGN